MIVEGMCVSGTMQHGFFVHLSSSLQCKQVTCGIVYAENIYFINPWNILRQYILKFTILMIKTGFGMLESGCVSLKNEVNIMMKNVVDVVLGGITYWAFGYGLSYGSGPGTNPFLGVGCWCVLLLGSYIYQRVKFRHV